MGIRTLATIFLIVFGLAFYWGGGSEVLKTADSTKETVNKASNAYNRIYRIIALKSAVDEKLNHNNYVKLADIPLSLQQATIAVEDNRFYRHFGLDIEGILRASLVNIQTGTIAEGGSTITQQLAKNLFLSQERSFTRKLEEAILALDLELRYSKEEILEMYLNTIYYGSGTYGVKEAAKVYFNKRPADLNLSECAMLAGIPNAPSLMSPYVNYEAAKQRQAVVLNAMVRSGYIGPSQAAEAKTTALKLAKPQAQR